MVAALSSDGRYPPVGRSYGSVKTSTKWSAIAYTADGKEMWTKSYDRSQYRTIEVDGGAGAGFRGLGLYV